jgi:hypothetical protein
MTEKAIPKTRLRIFYEAPLQAHAIRNWVAGHPRIVLPIGKWRGVVPRRQPLNSVFWYSRFSTR